MDDYTIQKAGFKRESTLVNVRLFGSEQKVLVVADRYEFDFDNGWIHIYSTQELVLSVRIDDVESVGLV